MYTGGLGEILPARKSVTVVPITAANWSTFESGAAHGALWDVFKEASGYGWVTYTPTGYETFLAWWQSSTGDKLAARLLEFTGWYYARLPVGVTSLQASLASYLRSGAITQTDAQVIVDAYNKYFTGTGQGGTLPVPTVPATVAPTPPQPDPRYPVGIQLLLAAPPVTMPMNSAAGIVLAYRTMTVYTGALGPGLGNILQGPWRPTPAEWVTMLGAEWRGGTNVPKGTHGSRWVGQDPDSGGFQAAASRVTSGSPYTDYARIASDTQAFESWLRSVLPSWSTPTGNATPPSTPIPVPAGVPYVPGSTVIVPPAGSGQETQVILPGTSTPIPASQVTPAMIPASGPPPEVMASESPAMAGMFGNGLGGLLLIGAVVGLALASRKRGR